MKRNLKDVPFVVVDLETTGGAPFGGSEITEFGAVQICGGVVMSEYSTFVRTVGSIPHFIVEMTGITDAMIADSPSIDTIFPQFIDWVGPHDETVLIAHNAPFDMSFLRAAAMKLDYPWPKYLVLDTVKIARAAIDRDEVPNYKLSTLAQFFNTQVQPTHRALDDAKTTVEIFHRILERLGSNVTTLEELHKYKRR
jgi:DNA polymerase III epsilon subunit family exonuclease